MAAISAALLGALLLTYTERRWPEIQEALIGVLVVLAACAGIVLLANTPHGGEHLKDQLVGQILWVRYTQLIPVALHTAVVMELWLGMRDRLGQVGYYALFAIVVTASVQLVCVFLVFASLMIRALAIRYHPSRRRLVVGFAVGVLGYAFGLVLSAVLDLPSGAVGVWTLAVCGMAAASLARWGNGAKPDDGNSGCFFVSS